MHRQILGLTDPKIFTDHKDHNGLNNQRSNLRIATHGQNMANKSPSGKSKYMGVSWNKNDKKWRSQIRKNRVTIYLGSYINEIDAAIAYNNKAVEVHGEFANLNVF